MKGINAKQIVLLIIIGFFSGTLGSLVIYFFTPKNQTFVENYSQAPVITNSRYQAMANSSDNFIKASAVSTRSVVYIKTVSSSSVDQYNWFDFYFNGRTGQELSSGSGVIFTNNGYIVTNNHVIDRAEQIEVIHNKRSYPAKVIGIDPSTDIAVIKIEAENLPAIKIASLKEVQVGEWVLAVGNPFNLTSTVTAGIVSAKGRDINVVKSRFPIESFIQTDAAINPGNSGGALVNIEGELIGINTAILSETGSYAGYGFAVPINIVDKAVKDIIEFGEVQKAFTGLEVLDLNTEIGNKLHTQDLSGVVVAYVQKDGASAKVGIQKGDIIIKINGNSIDSKAQFEEQISYQRPGDRINVVYKREDKEYQATLELTNIEGTTAIIKREIYKSTILGAELERVSKVEREKLSIESGIKLLKMTPNGFFRRTGIEEGFIITAVNFKKVNYPKELEEVFQKARGRVVVEGVAKNGYKQSYQFFM